MGVDRTDYIVYGYKLPYEMSNKKGPIDFWDENFEPTREGHEGEEFTLIIDGMCGRYSAFGLLIESGGDKYEGWDFVNLDFKNFDAEKVKAKYREVFELDEDEPVAEPYLFIFSHFS